MIVVLIAGVIAGIAWPSYLEVTYLATKPRTPEAQSGRVYPLDIKSAIVYVNRQELNRMNFAHHEVLYFDLFCVFALIFIKQYYS